MLDTLEKERLELSKKELNDLRDKKLISLNLFQRALEQILNEKHEPDVEVYSEEKRENWESIVTFGPKYETSMVYIAYIDNKNEKITKCGLLRKNKILISETDFLIEFDKNSYEILKDIRLIQARETVLNYRLEKGIRS